MAQRFIAFNMQVGKTHARYAGAVQRAVEQFARRWAREVEVEARRVAPKDKGRLQGSIRAAVLWSRDRIASVVGTNCRYARFVEFGTSLIRVGSPRNPRTTWYTKERKGPSYPNPSATMPYLRAARFRLDKSLREELRKIRKEVF